MKAKNLAAIASLLSVFLLPCIAGKAAGIKEKSILPDGKERIYNYDKYGISIIELHGGFEFLFIPKDVPSVKDVAEKVGFRFVINASFYDGDNLNAGHAGWLRLFGRTYCPVKKDSQLTHIFKYDTVSKKVAIIPCLDFKGSNSSNSIEFQTGPLVIEGNKIDLKDIKESINGFRHDKRSLLAVDRNGTIYFITVREGIPLDRLGRHLLRLPVFSKKTIDVVNLDGGPSVALYVKNFPGLNYNESARLPLLLGVK